MSELEKHITQIKDLCSKHKVRTLYAFGSVLNKNFNQQSDVDFIVDFEPVDTLHYADNYYDLKFSLEDIFNRSIDLLEEKAIRNPYFRQSVNQHWQLLYGH